MLSFSHSKLVIKYVRFRRTDHAMTCSAPVVPQVFSMSMAQILSVLDVSDAESDSRDKTRVWSNVTVWFYLRRRLAEGFL